MSTPDAPGLHSAILDSLQMQRGQLAPGCSSLLQQVVGAGGTSQGYLYGGLTTALGLRWLLQASGKGDLERILDFGCGSARVIRWFSDLSPGVELYGTDIHSAAIDWARESVPWVRLGVNSPEPPLDYPDAAFDVVFGVSVVTHLDEGLQNLWLREMSRILAPDGVLILTIHGDTAAQQGLPEVERSVLDEAGFLYLRAEDATVSTLPDFYQVAYHTRDYVRRHWGRHFAVHGFVSGGPFYRQEAVVLTHPGQRVGLMGDLELPLACLDLPAVGSNVHSPVPVSGWCFHPTGERVRDIDLVVDGVRAESLPVGRSSPSVREVFQTFPDADRAGFSSVVELAEGPTRVAWLTSGETRVPLAGTFFAIGS